MRNEASFQSFRTFLADMETGDIGYRGETFTWDNNREEEGFIQERLDRFCGSAEWMIQNEKAEVKYVLRQTSDHALILLYSNPGRAKTKGRFIWDVKIRQEHECEEIVKEVWGGSVGGSRMFRVK